MSRHDGRASAAAGGLVTALMKAVEVVQQFFSRRLDPIVIPGKVVLP